MNASGKFPTKSDRIAELEQQLSNALQKDSLKTNEINVLTVENRKLLKEIERLRGSAWNRSRE